MRAVAPSAIKTLDKQFDNTVMRLGDQARAPIAGIPPARWGWTRRPEAAATPAAESSRSLVRSEWQDHADPACHRRPSGCWWHGRLHRCRARLRRKLRGTSRRRPRRAVREPDHGEQAMEVVDRLVSSGGVDLVVDSVAALTPRAELEGDMADHQVGLQARLMSKGMRKLAGAVSRTNATVIFINQLRQKIGVMFGPSTVTTGGNALKYYCSLRLEVRRIGAIKDGQDIVGNRTRVKTVKNKLALHFGSSSSICDSARESVRTASCSRWRKTPASSHALGPGTASTMRDRARGNAPAPTSESIRKCVRPCAAPFSGWTRLGHPRRRPEPLKGPGMVSGPGRTPPSTGVAPGSGGRANAAERGRRFPQRPPTRKRSVAATAYSSACTTSEARTAGAGAPRPSRMPPCSSELGGHHHTACNATRPRGPGEPGHRPQQFEARPRPAACSPGRVAGTVRDPRATHAKRLKVSSSGPT